MLLNPPWAGRTVAPGTVALDTSTPGGYNITVPAGVFKGLVRLVGAGAGGGGMWNAGDAWSGNGGGSGGYQWDVEIAVTPGEVISVAVGAPGIGGSGLSTGTWVCTTSQGLTFIGSEGGTSSFGPYLVATGGKPGGNSVAGAVPPNQSEGGIPNGTPGTSGVVNCLTSLPGGSNGTGYGTGGYGGGCLAPTGYCGQDGTAGYAKVTWL